VDGTAGDGALPPELAAVQASLLALLAAARSTLDAVEALVAEPRTFAAGAQLVQETATLAGPLVRAVAASLLTPPSETGR
jgi:hypothetical protein